MASPRPRRNVWLLVRLLLYVAVAAFIFTRGAAHRPGREPREPALPVFSPADTSLSIAGADLAPELVSRVVQNYRDDYPRLRIDVAGGGTARALEELANDRADVAFLNRPPTPAEQEIFRSATRDTAIWFPVALGGIVFLRNATAPERTLTVAALRRFVNGEPGTGIGRLFAPDPNLGVWDALTGRVDTSRPAAAGSSATAPAAPGTSTAGTNITFLHDETEVIAAVRADQAAIGVVSSLNVPETPAGLATVAVSDSDGAAPAQPTDEAIAFSRYPLPQYLYVACRPRGGIQGSMFVTYLTGDRGQRQLERAGYLPARRVLREIHLSTHPVGASAGGRTR